VAGGALLDEQGLAVHEVVAAVDELAATQGERRRSSAGERRHTDPVTNTDVVDMRGLEIEGRRMSSDVLTPRGGRG
jgi:hypothetical protein